MSHHSTRRFRGHVELVKQRLQEGTLAFTATLSEELIREVLAECGVQFRERVYTPWITLWTFISQCFTTDGTCQEAVCRLNACRLRENLSPCSPDSSHYCQARARLPVEFFQRLFQRQIALAEAECPAQWRWMGRHEVKVIDGTTLTMPDTPENREAFPPDGETVAGTRFPILRAVVVFSLSMGLAKEFAFGPYQGKGTGEISLLRRLWHAFEPGDVALGDKYYCSYQDVHQFLRRSVNVVVKHFSYRTTLTTIKRLGKHDFLCHWHRPKFASQKMSRADFEQLPKLILVRRVTVHVAIPGFRSRRYEILTTLLDAKVYTAGDLAELYFRRWRGEMYLDDIKTTLGMDVLRCRTVSMIHKEILVGLLAYNTVRLQMCQAAACLDVPLGEISFKTTLVVLKQFDGLDETEEMIATKLATIAHTPVGQRPGRSEPRAVKRKAKPYESLKKPRQNQHTHP